MKSLSTEDKETILDYYFRCGPDEHIDRARELIVSDPRAAELYTKLEMSLKQLDSVKYEPCPDNLAELTIARLKHTASESQIHLENLLASEQKKTAGNLKLLATDRQSFWRRFSEVAAVAAAILLIISVSVPSFSRMRQMAWKMVCDTHLQRIGLGIANYAQDHNGNLPYVATSAGSPWWKIGDTGPKNQSNTRHLWLLAKDDYVDSKNFVCPGRKNARAVKLSRPHMQKLHDFPAREYISFSFRFTCDKMTRPRKNDRTVLLADLNPVFEKIFDSSQDQPVQKSITIRLSNNLLKMMSTSHAGRGQNILFGDGHVKFIKVRNVAGDDIYTVNGISIYSGCETPASGDIFLAP